MLDDRQPQSRAASHARARLVHAEEALEDPFLVLLGDADALVDDGDAYQVRVRGIDAHAHTHSGARIGVADGVVQEVAHGGGDERRVPTHHEALGTTRHQRDLAGLGCHPHPVHGLGDHGVQVDVLGAGQRVTFLKPGELDDLLDQHAQAA